MVNSTWPSPISTRKAQHPHGIANVFLHTHTHTCTYIHKHRRLQHGFLGVELYLRQEQHPLRVPKQFIFTHTHTCIHIYTCILVTARIPRGQTLSALRSRFARTPQKILTHTHTRLSIYIHTYIYSRPYWLQHEFLGVKLYLCRGQHHLESPQNSCTHTHTCTYIQYIHTHIQHT
jgi:hypothetical protein